MKLATPYSTIHRSLTRPLAVILALTALFIAGCDSTNNNCNIASARIRDAASVFRVFENVGNNCFLFEGGLFGPTGGSTSPTQLCFSAVQPQAQPPIARFMTTPEDPNDVEGEGDSDGAASCNYRYDTDPTMPILCPLCDVIVNATNIKAGGSGPGTIELHLAGNRDPETLADPPLVSTTIDATVGTDAQCSVTSLNGVAVVEEQ